MTTVSLVTQVQSWSFQLHPVLHKATKVIRGRNVKSNCQLVNCCLPKSSSVADARSPLQTPATCFAVGAARWYAPWRDVPPRARLASTGAHFLGCCVWNCRDELLSSWGALLWGGGRPAGLCCGAGPSGCSRPTWGLWGRGALWPPRFGGPQLSTAGEEPAGRDTPEAEGFSPFLCWAS